MEKVERIVCTVTNDLSYDQRMIRICSCLSERGYQVTLIGRHRKNSIPLKEQGFKQERIKCFFNKGFIFYAEFNVRLFLKLLFRRMDIVNSVDLDTIVPGLIISKLRNKLLVYDAHEYFTEVPEVIDRPLVQKVWAKIASVSIPKVDLAYTVGASLQKIFESKYGRKFHVVRNLPFMNKVQSQSISAPKIILYQGALNVGRGLEQMIELMDGLQDYQLMIIGEGDLSETLRNLASSLKNPSRVKFVGFVDPENLPRFTANAWIGINLLENKGLSYYYSLANRTFDFIQAEIPAIHMNFPEYQNLNSEIRIAELIDDLNLDSIKAAIERLENKENYEEIKENCKRAAEIFTWEKEKQSLIKIWQEMISHEK